MPANLPPAYHDAEERFRAARTPPEKIAALEEMLRVIPKHKGTEKLQAGIKTRIARLRRQPRKKAATRSHSHVVPREGAGQIALVGPPNSGKSSLVARLTHARPEVADYPFTTRQPIPGMMPFEDIAFQLVDLPPLSETHVEPWVFDLIRHADLLWLVVEINRSLDGLEEVRRLLDARRIESCAPGAPPGRERSPGSCCKPALLVVTGADKPGSGESLRILRELTDLPWPLVMVSTADGSGLAELGRVSYQALGILRVYTKQPGKPADMESPFTLPCGSTVDDLARLIHKDLSEQLKFARIWGRTVFDGQTVHREHVLEEGDVIEIH